MVHSVNIGLVTGLFNSFQCSVSSICFRLVDSNCFPNVSNELIPTVPNQLIPIVFNQLFGRAYTVSNPTHIFVSNEWIPHNVSNKLIHS